MANRGTRTFPGKNRSQPFDFQAVGQGLFSQRPPAGFPGRFFYATDNSILYVDTGLAWQALNPRMISHGDSAVTVNTTTSETDLANFTIGAGTLAVGDALRFTAYGDALSNGSNNSFQFRFKFGSTTMFGPSTGNTFASGANRKAWAITCIVHATGAATQSGSGILNLGASLGGATNAWSDTNTQRSLVQTNTAAETIANAITVKLTCQPENSSATAECKMFSYECEKMTA